MLKTLIIKRITYSLFLPVLISENFSLNFKKNDSKYLYDKIEIIMVNVRETIGSTSITFNKESLTPRIINPLSAIKMAIK